MTGKGHNPTALMDLLTDAPLQHGRSGGIDLLRGVLALWVIATHVILFSMFAQGTDAVPGLLARAYALLDMIFEPSIELHPAVLGFIVLSATASIVMGCEQRTAGRSALILRVAPFGFCPFIWWRRLGVYSHLRLHRLCRAT